MTFQRSRAIKKEFRFDLGSMDVEGMKSDAEIHAAADRVLPRVLREYARAIAREICNPLAKTFKSTSSEKQKLLRETTGALEREHRNHVRQLIIDRIRQLKRESPPAGPEALPPTR